ncbi:hypothetical protein DFP72DRAFT_532279 [Ephemerocybe angulata]|uniref:Uncharacterized protein n=1 Tax=Ephemerocybe angulata TaxID=980116 RepID=A0A8H6HP19_9AGAR|nr:hypothetical protein DFP72DRAFT_532279 [Tulosesus angulatus]
MEATLPLDILSLVPYYLDREDATPTLMMLCLTSPVFIHSCRALRFNRITLSSHSRGTLAGKRLFDLLEASPNLPKYIKGLAILDFVTGTTSAHNSSWLVVDVALPDALNRLYTNQISSFTFRRSRREPWISLPATTQSALFGICRSTSLVELNIRRAPLSLLSHCGPSLKRFHSRDAITTKDYGFSPRPRSTAEYIELDSLHLDNYQLDQQLAYLLDPFNKISLHALTELDILAASPGDHTCVSTILGFCRESLKTLVLEPCTHVRAPEVDISDCSSLTNLQLHLDVTCQDRRGDRLGLPWATSFINKIPASISKKIEIFAILLYFDIGDFPEMLEGNAGEQEFFHLREIGDVVTGRRHTANTWTGLKKFIVEVSNMDSGISNMGEIEAWALCAFNVHPNSNLEVSVKTSEFY